MYVRHIVHDLCTTQAGAVANQGGKLWPDSSKKGGMYGCVLPEGYWVSENISKASHQSYVHRTWNTSTPGHPSAADEGWHWQKRTSNHQWTTTPLAANSLYHTGLMSKMTVTQCTVCTCIYRTVGIVGCVCMCALHLPLLLSLSLCFVVLHACGSSRITHAGEVFPTHVNQTIFLRSEFNLLGGASLPKPV